MFVLVFLFVNAVVVATSLDREFAPSDVGDIFVKSQKVAAYADERLVAAARSAPLPEPPRILADQFSLRMAMIATLISQVCIFGIVGIASKQDFTALMRTLGVTSYDWSGVWRPAAVVFGAYLAVAIYSVAARTFLPDLFQPQSTVPTEITRSEFTLAIAAVVTVIGAPFTEELFFRGFVFGGLSRWGFWKAAPISALLFALVHFDPGSVIPFFGIGVLMAWLFWSRGSLWDSVLFHFLFNLTSFSFLAFA